MRRPTHPYRVLFLGLLAGALMLSGCAQAGTGASAPGPDLPSSAAPLPPETLPSGECITAATGEPVVVSETDTGKDVCLTTGGRLEIYLQGTASDKWSDLMPSSDVLKRAPSGKGALAVGVTGGFFVGDHAGQTQVTATRDGTQFEIHVMVR
jgi:hypothetical protein